MNRRTVKIIGILSVASGSLLFLVAVALLLTTRCAGFLQVGSATGNCPFSYTTFIAGTLSSGMIVALGFYLIWRSRPRTLPDGPKETILTGHDAVLK